MAEWRGDDIDPEDVVETDESGEEHVNAKLAKLREEISTMRKEKQEYMDGWQRSKADYVNALKRFEEERKYAEMKGVSVAVVALLPAFDSLERARIAGELPEGFKAIARQLETAITALGVRPLGEVGEKFDPKLHEALGTDPVDAKEKDDLVTAVLENGWKIGDTVIRPAKVRVSHFASKREEV